jgi:argininosuccinate synthase
LQKKGRESNIYDKGQIVESMVNGCPKKYCILEKLANAYAIGRDTHVGDTIIGLKEELVFGCCSSNYNQSTSFTGETYAWKMATILERTLGNWYGMLFHEGSFLIQYEKHRSFPKIPRKRSTEQ